MTHWNHDAILAHAAATYPGRKIRISNGAEYAPVSVKKIPELPYDQHSQVIDQIRELAQPGEKGLGETAERLLAESEDKVLKMLIRQWLRFYSCRRSDAVKMINRQFPLA